MSTAQTATTSVAPALSLPRSVAVFAAFALAYFLSALVRAVTATLAPVFSVELGLGAGQLGLLAGVYFLGFAAMQLPLGWALDRWGPRRVLLAFLALAMVGCVAFAAAQGLAQLLAARLLIGMGVSACLMAPLTCYRRIFSVAAQQRANSWMLMTGSLGMVASTMPVQWLLPSIGWRGLFVAVAVLLALAAANIWRAAPRDPVVQGASAPVLAAGYRVVFAHPAFIRMAPLAVVVYGGLLALQTLWIGPWLTQVAGQTPVQASQGLLLVNLAMLLTFLAWGALMPRLTRNGWAGERLIASTWPLGALCLLAIVWLGPQAGAWHWAAFCVATSVVSLSQPALGQAFAPELAGRALSAFNLLIFAGVFALQSGIGLGIDGLRALGFGSPDAHRLAFAGYAVAYIAALLWLNLARRLHGVAEASPAAMTGQDR